MRKGQMFTEEQRQKIVWLLSSTELTTGEIAERMRCSRSAVASINRHHQIRDYALLKRARQKVAV
jgi:DNA-binding CsgD family transcriptional regulator